jgi:cardiolipin synthase
MIIPWWAHSFLSILTFFFTLLFVSSILRAKKAAGSTLGWLIAICLVPYVGIPLYLFFSTRKFNTRLTAKKKVYPLPATQIQANENLSSSQKILKTLGVPPAKENKNVELLPTGVDAYNTLLQLIRDAKKTIFLTTFIFGKDPVGEAVVEALVQKAREGIDVRVLVDSLGAAWVRHPSFSKLRKSGGQIAITESLSLSIRNLPLWAV